MNGYGLVQMGRRLSACVLGIALALGPCPAAALSGHADAAASVLDSVEAQGSVADEGAAGDDELAEGNGTEAGREQNEGDQAEGAEPDQASLSDEAAVLPAVEDGGTLDARSAPAVSVGLSVQMYGGFLFAPQLDEAVFGDLAEGYGYADKVAGGVSALDALVRAHEIAFGSEFSPDTARAFLEVSESGFVTRMFCEESYASGFVLNGGYPGGKNGTTVTTQALVDGDAVDFFLYQDVASYADQISWFCKNGTYIEEVSAKTGEQIPLTVKGYMHVGGYAFDTPEQMRLAGSPLKGARIAWVDMASGSLDEVAGAATDDQGCVNLGAPQTEGVYYLTAFTPAASTAQGAPPVILSLLKVVVDDSAVQADPCALEALEVMSLDSMPNALEMTPAFESALTQYRTEQVPFAAASYLRLCYVKATAAHASAVMSARLNGGAPKAVASGSTVSFSGADLLQPGDNILTVAVRSSADADADERIYAICIPMEDPDAPAKAVKTMIAELGEVTLGSGPAIQAARAAYDALSESHKALVDNHYLLVEAEALFASLEVMKQADDARSATASYLSSTVSSPTVSSTGGEWAIIGFAREGSAVEKDLFQRYVNNVSALLIEKQGQLSKNRYTEYARVVLALTSIGFDVTDVAGYDLLEPLADFATVCQQGVNGPIWALIAFDSHGYDIPEAPEGSLVRTSRDLLVGAILDAQLPDGSWAVTGTEPNLDATAMALTALAPYASADAQVAAAVEQAVEKLASFPDAGQGSWSSLGPEGCAQAIIALTSLGIDPAHDGRFAHTGDSPLHGLLAYAVPGGGFSRIAGGDADGIASEQGLMALVAYERFAEGEPAFYCMSDVNIDDDWKATGGEGTGGDHAGEWPLGSEPEASTGMTGSLKGVRDSLNLTGRTRTLGNAAGAPLEGDGTSAEAVCNALPFTGDREAFAPASAADGQSAAGLVQAGDRTALWLWAVLAIVGVITLTALACARRALISRNAS